MSTAADFWSWFGAEQARLATLAPDALVEEVQAQVQQVDPRIGVEVGRAEEGPTELVFIAGGDAEAFPAVRELVAAAAPLEGWTFTALKQPAGFEFTLTAGEIELAPAEWPFAVLQDPDEPHILGLRIFVPEELDDEEEVNGLLWLIVQTGLGEELASEVQHVEGAPRREDQRARTMHLRELPSFMEWRRAQRN